MKLHMNDTVEFYGIGIPGEAVDVSTLDTLDCGWETCVFLADGRSEVVARYVDIEAAVIGHHAFIQRDVLRFVAESIIRNRKGN